MAKGEVGIAFLTGFNGFPWFAAQHFPLNFEVMGFKLGRIFFLERMIAGPHKEDPRWIGCINGSKLLEAIGVTITNIYDFWSEEKLVSENNKVFLVGEGIGARFLLHWAIESKPPDSLAVHGIIVHAPLFTKSRGQNNPDITQIPHWLPTRVILRRGDENVHYVREVASVFPHIQLDVFGHCGIPQSPWGACRFSKLHEAWRHTLETLQGWMADD